MFCTYSFSLFSFFRIGPEGSSTGASLRQFPKSCVQQVREICLHYVEKCSGKYHNNEQAARYIHQMAEEVMGQLSGVSAQIKRHENEPAVFQALLDEWNEAFPPGLSKIGSPRVVANLLARQTAELEELRTALELERSSKETDIANVLRSMDAQIQISRNGIISERRQLSRIQQEEVEKYQRLLQEEQAKSNEALETLNEKLDAEMARVKTIGDSVVTEERAKIKAAEKRFEAERKKSKNDLAAQKKQFVAEKNEFNLVIKGLQGDVKRLENQVNTIMNFDNNAAEESEDES